MGSSAAETSLPQLLLRGLLSALGTLQGSTTSRIAPLTHHPLVPLFGGSRNRVRASVKQSSVLKWLQDNVRVLM